MLAPLVAVTSAPVAGNHAEDPAVRTYHAEQDDRCVELSALGDGETNVTEFYDYRGGQGTDYASYGTQDLQERQVSQVFVYHGVDGASLVFLHDSLEEDDQGGAVTMSISGLPSDGRWLVEDDDYGDDTDDNFVHSGTSSEIDWMWAGGRTDGAVFQGLDALADGDRILVEPAFGEESYAYQERSPQWPFATDDLTWRARDGEGDLVPLDEGNQLAIGPGDCPATPPTANVTTNTSTATVDESVTFDASLSFDESDVTAYHWDVDGDGTAETTTEDPVFDHSYDTAGTYDATLTVEDDDGETATATTSVEVTSEGPDVSIESSADFTPAREEHTWFNATSTDADIESCDWTFEYGPTVERTTGDGLDWGEGSTNCAKNYAFPVPGTYNVTLTVTDESGDTATTIRQVEVTPKSPVTDDPQPNAELQAPDSIERRATYDMDASNSSSEDDVRYNILESKPDNWDSDERNLGDRERFSAYYTGDFDTIDVAFGVLTVNGQTDWAWQTIEVLPVEKPNASVDGPDSVVVDETVEFDASNSTDNGRIRAYNWTIHDTESGETVYSSVEAGQTEEYQFDDPGTYEVTVQVGDYVNQSLDGPYHYGVDTKTVTVVEASPPTAEVSANRTDVSAGSPVRFDGGESSDEQGIASYEWDFDGDGTVDDTGETTNYSYDSAGSYDATLTVTDGAGNTDTANVTITVQTAGSTTAALQAPSTAMPDEDVTFDASGSTAEGGVSEYRWDVGSNDSVEFTTDAPTLVQNYTETGERSVTVTVVDADGETASATVTVTVAEDSDPTASMTADPTTVEAGSEVSFDGSDSSDDRGIESHEWDFDGDGTVDETGETTTHTYENAGTYTANLTVRDDGGNTDRVSTTITVEKEADGGGGGGGAIGGGFGGGADDDDDEDERPTNAAAERADDGSVRVTVENATAGETVGVSVPGGTDGNASVRAVEFVPTNDADRLNLSFVTGNLTAPNGTDAGLLELRVADGADVDSVTYQFAVGRPATDARLRTLVANGSGWAAVNHTVVENGSTTLVNATVDDADDVAVAKIAPDVRTDEISLSRDVIVGDEATVETTFVNDGHAATNRTVELGVDGTAADSRDITIPANGSTTVTFETMVSSAGDHRVTVGDAERTLHVATPEANVSMTDVSLASEAIAPGDDVRLRATFENTGEGTGTVRANFTLAGDVVEVQRTTLEPGERATMTFEESLDATGSYDVGVNGEQRTVTVNEPATEQGTTETNTTTPTDGGGDDSQWVIVGFGALVVVAAGLSRLV